MANKHQIARSQWKDAIGGSGGLISMIAARLGIPPSTVQRQIELKPALQKAVRDEEEALKDMAECRIQQAILAQDLKVSMWYLTRKGKDRGYGTAVKVDSRIEPVGRIHLILPDDGRDFGDGNAKLLS